MKNKETETRILNFKDNEIEPLTLEELESSVGEESYSGKPLMGMYHYEFIKAVMDQVNKAGCEGQITQIFAAQNRDKTRPGATVIPDKRELYGDGDVRSFILRRIFGEINITSLEDDQTSTAIGLSYNQLGFQLAFGPRVKVCKNLSILGADRFMSTYASQNNMPNPQRMIEVLSDWLHNFEEERARDVKIMDGLQNQIVPHNQVLEIIGDLTSMRIKRENNKFPKQALPPLNQGQIGKFATRYLVEKATNESKEFSAWELYNFATEMYRPGQTDMPIILSSNYAMSQYLMNRYNLN